MESPVGRTLLRLTGVSLVAVAVVALIAPRRVSVDYRWQVVVRTVVVGIAFAVRVRVPSALKSRWLPGVIAVAGASVATFVAMQTRYQYGWDAGAVMSMARSLHAGRPLSEHELDYLSVFPNNLPLLAIDRAAADVGQSLGVAPDAVLIALGGIGLAVTLYAVHVLVGALAGRGPALVAQIVTIALVGLSPWLSVPYTDVLAMPLVVGGAAGIAGADAGTAQVTHGAVDPQHRGTRSGLRRQDDPRRRRGGRRHHWHHRGVRPGAAPAAACTGSQRNRRGPCPVPGPRRGAARCIDDRGRVDTQDLRPDASPTLLWWVANGSAETV